MNSATFAEYNASTNHTNLKYVDCQLAIDNKKFAIQTLNKLLIVQNSEILHFQYTRELRLWQMILTDMSAHKLRRISTAKNILSMSPSFIQISQDNIININYLESIENQTRRCLFRTPFQQLEIRATQSYYEKIKKALVMI